MGVLCCRSGCTRRVCYVVGLAVLDGCIYAVAGWEGSGRLDSVEQYNPTTNLWTFVARVKMAVTSPAVVSHNGLLYVTGKY